MVLPGPWFQLHVLALSVCPSPYTQSPCLLPSSSNHTHFSTPFLPSLPSLRPNGRNPIAETARDSFASSPARSWNLSQKDQLPKELVKTEISWLRMGGEGNGSWRKVLCALLMWLSCARFCVGRKTVTVRPLLGERAWTFAETVPLQ